APHAGRAETAGKRNRKGRRGGGAQGGGDPCYESNGPPRRYSARCERRYSWGTAREDYVLPDAHTVAIRIAPQQLGGVNGECTWSWQARKAGGKTESKGIACTDKLTIARGPYAPDRHQSGASVPGKLPDGRELAEPEVVVEDLFIVALGDSFASGESNPDRPVQFSAGRGMVYEPARRPRVESAGQACHAELRARRQRRSVQSQGATAAVHGRRGGRALLRPRFTRIPGRIREGVGTLAEPRLPSLAIRLSVPCGDRA